MKNLRLLLTLMIFAFAACSTPVPIKTNSPLSTTRSTGSVTFTLTFNSSTSSPSTSRAATILTNVGYATIQLYSETDHTTLYQSQVVTGNTATFTFSNVVPEVWDAKVQLYDSQTNGNLRYYGTNKVNVVGGSTTTASVPLFASGSTDISLSAGEYADSLTIADLTGSTTGASVNPSTTYQLVANVLPTTADPRVLWSSNLPSVASVDQTGLVTAKVSGTATITAKAEQGGVLAVFTIAVVLPVSFDANGGSGTMGTQYIANTATATLRANEFAYAGYSFTGWNTSADGSGKAYSDGASLTMGPAKVTLYAQWSPGTNTVSYNANGGTGTMANQTILTGNSATLGTNTFSRAGYTFAGWNADATGKGTNLANGASYTMGASSLTLFAQWTAVINTITFDPNGGSGTMTDQSLATDASATLSANGFTNAGYVFTGWNIASSGSGSAYSDGATYTMGTSNVTLYAQWSPATNTVTFNANGGTGAMSGQTISNGNSAALTPNAFTRVGYTFTDWNTSSNGSGTSYADAASYTMGANSVTLYAQWTVNINTVTFNANGGTGTMADQTIATAATASLVTNGFSYPGFTFTGWNAAANGSGTTYSDGTLYTMGTASLTLYAQWTANNNTISFNANGGTGTMSHQTLATNASANLTTNTFTRAGYTFANWNTAANGSGTVYAGAANYTMGIANVTLYAQWTANLNTITFSANAGSGTMGNQTIATAAIATLTTNAYTRAGYTFANWNTAANGTGTAYAGGASYTMGTASVTLYAQWTANQNTVTFNANGGAGTMNSQTLATAATATLTTNAFTYTGYTFAGWTTAANGSGTAYSDGASYTMGTASATLYAQWTPNNYAVTFNANAGSGAMANQIFSTGATANLTANAFGQAGYTFAGWNTVANGSGTAYSDAASYTMGIGNTILYAQWTAKSYTVTFDSNGGTSGTMANQVIASGTTTTLSADKFSLTNDYFTGWNTASDGTGTWYADGASVTMGASGFTLYAQWQTTTQATFDANGGTGSMAPKILLQLLGTNLPNNTFTRAGYTFAHWTNTGADTGAMYSNGGYYPSSGGGLNMLFAQWTPNSNTVTFNANGGTGTMSSKTFATDATKKLTANAFTRTGYTFTGWNSVAGGGGAGYADGASYTMGPASVTLYAQWTADSQ